MLAYIQSAERVAQNFPGWSDPSKHSIDLKWYFAKHCATQNVNVINNDVK